MGKTKKESQPETISPISCEILGKELKQAVMQLKVAFPRKKAEKERASVMIYGLPEGLRFVLPGADVLATAKVSNEFIVVIPWTRFKHTFVLSWKAAEIIKLEFSDNCISVNRVAVRSPEIKFHHGIAKKTICDDGPSQGEKLGANVEETLASSGPVDSPSNPPLLDAHFYMKKYGFRQFLANRDFVDQQEALRRALDEATRILEPIGITRTEIEQMIEEKIKKMPGYKSRSDTLGSELQDFEETNDRDNIINHGTLYGVDRLFYEWLGLDSGQLDNPKVLPNYGTLEIAREICNNGTPKKSPPITEAFQQIQNNHLSALNNGPRPPQNSNYRWSKQLKMQAHNYGEKRLEKLAASILDDDWVNQVPVCSGFTWAIESKRAIDIARRLSESECEFIELKYARDAGGANHPLFAAIEILEYGLAFLMARQNSLIKDAEQQKYLRGVSKINLVVLAPAEFFEGFELAWLLNAFNDGLAQLVEDENLQIEMSLRCNVLSNEFITFYHGLEDLIANEKICYEESGIKSNDDDINLGEIKNKFQTLFPLYRNLFG